MSLEVIVMWSISAVWLIGGGHVMITLLFTLRDLTDLGRELSDELSEIQRIRRELSAVHHVGGSE
jgi:hypothetical protein